MSYKLYRKKDYAELVGVKASRVSQLMDKLKVSNKMGDERIIDCPSNRKLFERASHLRGKTIEIKRVRKNIKKQ